MLVFWCRSPTIGGPRPETWRWLCDRIAPRPVLYVTRTVFYVDWSVIQPIGSFDLHAQE